MREYKKKMIKRNGEKNRKIEGGKDVVYIWIWNNNIEVFDKQERHLRFYIKTLAK